MWSLVLNTHPSFSVVGEAASAEEGIRLAIAHHPDVIIMDINLPDINGIEATKRIKPISLFSKALGVSLHVQPTNAKAMMGAGASGYLTKSSFREEMFVAVAETIKGKRYICEEVKNILSEQMFNAENDPKGGDQ